MKCFYCGTEMYEKEEFIDNVTREKFAIIECERCDSVGKIKHRSLVDCTPIEITWKFKK